MRGLLLFLMCVYTLSIKSQIYSYKNFSEDEGLPQAFIYDICQDNRGFLYIATGEGLATFGGYNFKNFTTVSGLSENFVTSIFQDSKNRMWLGHFEGGISLLKDDGAKTDINYTQSTRSKITQIAEYTADTLLFLKNNVGLIFYFPNTEKFILFEDEFYNDVTSFIFSGNSLLVLKQDGIYTVYVPDLLSKKASPKKLTDLEEGVFITLNTAKNKYIVFDKNLGIITYRADDRLIAQDTLKIPNSRENVYTKFHIDRFDRIYIGTTENGFYKIDLKERKIKNFSVKNGLKTNSIQSLFIDREDNLWIGTFGKGLQQLKNELYSYKFLYDNQFHTVAINSVTKKNNSYYVATNNGLGIIEENVVKYLSHSKLLSSPYNHLIYLKGVFIFSTKDGDLFKCDSNFKKITPINIVHKDQKIFINAICYNKSEVFICTTSGLFILDPLTSNYQLLNTENGLLHNFVKYVYRDSKGLLWVCSPGSPIYTLDKNLNKKVYKDIQGLRNFNINSVCEDINKNIWISTIGDGIFRYDGKKFTNYTLLNGLKSNYCYGIVADGAEGIWVNHINGISYKSKYKKNFNKIENISDLMQLNFIENSKYQDRASKEITFGAAEGIITINTSKQKYNETIPKLNLLSVSYNNKIATNTNDTILAYDAYDITFYFIGVCLTDPDKVQYKYKLEGMEDSYTFLSSETRKLSFSKLKDGDYTLKIFASNNDNLWTTTPLTYHFKIEAPFWKKIWFYILLVLFLSGLVILIIKLRTKKLIQNKKELEEIIRIKTKQISQEKIIVEELYYQIKSKNKDITDSLNYAKHIQEALLPRDEYMSNGLDVAYFYKAKDIVSGDFYWYKRTKNYHFIAAVDCTGHGVPGAFMSFIGSTILDDIVSGDENLNPVQILHRLDAGVIKILNQHSKKNEMNKDGMDICICKFDPKTNILESSGAVRPLFIYSEGNLKKIKNIGYSIGGAFQNLEKPFILTTHQVKKGDNIFMYSDGMVDQFGGDNEKKYSSSRLRDFILRIAEMPTSTQKLLMREEYHSWKGDYEQIDDVLFMSVKFRNLD